MALVSAFVFSGAAVEAPSPKTPIIQNENTKPQEIAPEIMYYSEQDIIDIAKVLYNECRGVENKTEQACVAWVILNRVDAGQGNIHSIVRASGQFAFSEKAPATPELLELARDVLSRWNEEKNGHSDVGRVLPKEYCYFGGNGKRNLFRNAYQRPYKIWDYSLASPYTEAKGGE